MVEIYIEPYFKYYIIAWLTACAIAVLLVFRSYRSHAFLWTDYLNFLLRPWKVITATIAITCMALVAPYTGDPTWDYFDSIAMGVLTYLFAPWAVGTLYRAITKKVSFVQVYVAICLTMFSSSWFYDGYILLRDGFYPTSWLFNIPLSLTLFVSAGLLWNLERNSETGSIFAFQNDNWLAFDKEQGFNKVIWLAMPFMLFVIILVGLFVWKGFINLLGCSTSN